PRNIQRRELEGFMNDMNYSSVDINRSLRKYWYQETRRKYDIQHDIFYYTAPQPIGYYTEMQIGIELYREALESVIASNPEFDWSVLSKWSTSDPYIDEYPEQLNGAVKSTIIISSDWGPRSLRATFTPGWTLSNGVHIGRLQASALNAQSWSEARFNASTLIHESAHGIFNLPDTYDNDASSSGTADYSIMSSATKSDAAPVGAPFLYTKKWGYAKQPAIAGRYNYILPADGDTIVVIKNVHDPEEFFTLEVRKNTTAGNTLFPVSIGLLIWHSDLKVSTRNTQENTTRYAHYAHSIIQKDGLFELENLVDANNDAGDIYMPGDVFSDETNPDAHWWAGENSGIIVKDIVQLDDDHLQFTVEILEIHSEHYDFIPKENWSIVSSTSFVSGYDASQAIDGDPTTYYHVDGDVVGLHPHELVIDLGAEYEISEFYYTANPNFTEPSGGRVKDYELYFSTNGVDWGEPVAVEQFFNTDIRQYELSADGIARYIKFIALSANNSGSRPSMRRTSIAEIDLRGKEVIEKDVLEVNQTIADKIKLSPNPVIDNLIIEGLTQDQVVRIYNPFGVLFKEFKITGTSTELDMTSYPS
ncbi:MAG: discoidin domain-containing protein, partial [Bacteroidales bacterium]|nr:discoidin domain-containing protein [Bacteroidales bacterium]